MNTPKMQVVCTAGEGIQGVEDSRHIPWDEGEDPSSHTHGFPLEQVPIPRQGVFTPEWPQEEQHRPTSPAGEPGKLAGARSSHSGELSQVSSHGKSCALRTAPSREAQTSRRSSNTSTAQLCWLCHGPSLPSSAGSAAWARGSLSLLEPGCCGVEKPLESRAWAAGRARGWLRAPGVLPPLP